MSFNHLSSLEAQPITSSSRYSDDPEFSLLTSQLSGRLTTLISNVTQLNRQLSLVGTKKDTETVRDVVKRLIDETRTGFKSVSSGVKRVQAWPDVSPSMKFAQDKLQKQLAAALTDFQATQRLSAEKTRQYVCAARKAQHDVHVHNVHTDEMDAMSYTDEGAGGEEVQVLVPLVQQQAALAEQGEVEFQESLIVAREEEIRGIEQGITELHDIFTDLGMLVSEQEDTLNSISDNVTRTAQDHKAAHQELRSAARYQKGARNRACILLLILAIVLAVVLLAIFL